MKVNENKPMSIELTTLIKEFITNKDFKAISDSLGVSYRTITGLVYDSSNVTNLTKEAPILMLKKAMLNKCKIEVQTKEEIEEYRKIIKDKRRALRRLESLESKNKNQWRV